MQRALHLLGTLGILVVLAGSANAGYWEVVYDLAPNSTAFTAAVGLTDNDPLTGTLTLQFDAVSTAAPITGGRLSAGSTTVVLSQTYGGLFLMTGTSNTLLLPGSGGTPGVINGATLTLSPVADSNLTGFLHCTGGNCAFAGTAFVSSIPVPQTPIGSGPFPVALADFGKFVFTGGVGTSDFTSTGALVTVPGPPLVSVTTTYVGKEVSRIFVPEPAGWMQLAAGGAGLLVLVRRRTRTSRRES